MSDVRPDLDADWTQAIIQGRLAEFAQRVEQNLTRDRGWCQGWLFLARAKERLHELDQADACYAEAVRLASLQELEPWIKELETFAALEGKDRPLQLAKRRLKPSQSVDSLVNSAPVSLPAQVAKIGDTVVEGTLHLTETEETVEDRGSSVVPAQRDDGTPTTSPAEPPITFVPQTVLTTENLDPGQGSPLADQQVPLPLHEGRLPVKSPLASRPAVVGGSVAPPRPTQPVNVSRLIQLDLQRAEFRDRHIIEKGGKPDLDDAKRLLQGAKKTEREKLQDRYPLFLEAAKAFTMLPEGTYNPQDLLFAVARFALTRSGALVWTFRDQLEEGASFENLWRLRDSITSYSLEAVRLQLQMKPAGHFVWIALRNHLTVAIECFSQGRERFQGLWQRGLKAESDFQKLFSGCLCSGQSGLQQLAWETLVAAGSLSDDFFSLLSNESTSVRECLEHLKSKEQASLGILNKLRGQPTQPKEPALDLLRSAALDRRDQRKQIEDFFSDLEAIDIQTQGFAALAERWKRFPQRRAPLLRVDADLYTQVQNLLDTLSPYGRRGSEEQSMILTTARTRIAEQLSLIEQSPTYWGRVGFEPILLRLQGCIESLEQLRVRTIAPQLKVALEPPFFHLEDDAIVGGVLIANQGQATAQEAKVLFEVLSNDEQRLLWEKTLEGEGDIAPGASRHLPVRVPRGIFSQGIEALYTLNLRLAGDAHGQKSTLEIDRGVKIAPERIPWDETRKPSEEMFVGREEELDLLIRHLKSSERVKSYMLFGLTRMGKSSVLDFLARRIDLQPTGHPGSDSRFFAVQWDFADAANMKKASMWRSWLKDAIVEKAQRLAQEGALPESVVPELINPEEPEFEDWKKILQTMKSNRLYPVFLIDEFTYYGELKTKNKVQPSFLAAIRDFAIGGLASFIFAGTFDMRELLRDKRYGITAQLVNVLERRVSRIEDKYACQLIVTPMRELKFSEEAINYLLRLSWNIPYFIQILCKNLALFAVTTGRSHIGYLDVEQVVRCLTAETTADASLGISPLPPNTFLHNMDDPREEKKRCHALLTTLCDFLRGQSVPRPMPLQEIKNLWQHHGVPYSDVQVAEAVKDLKDRQVIIEAAQAGRPTYEISVDLFRRWWTNEHRFLETDLDLLKAKKAMRKGVVPS